MATLVDNVYVGGRFYGPDHGGDAEVTPEVAALITDPKAWGGAPPTSPASSSVEIEGVPLHQQTVIVDPTDTMTPEEFTKAQAAVEAEMRAAADPPPAIEGTKASLAASFHRLGVSEAMAEVPGFEWLANPDAQAVLVDIDGVDLSPLDDPQGTPS